MTEEWIFTFGPDNLHPVTGESLGGCYVRVPGDYGTSRAAMLGAFGRAWSSQYPADIDLAEYGPLREIPLP